MNRGMAGFICPVCGNTATGVSDRAEPVVNPETKRQHGWARTIRTYVHINGDEHRVPMGPIFERRKL